MVKISTALSMLKSGVLMLLLFGIVVRGLIPAGFMPDMTQQAATPIVICAGVDHKIIYVDDNGQPVPDQDQGRADGDGYCAFSLAGLAMAGAPVPSAIVAPVVFENFSYRHDRAALYRHTLDPSHRPTGPPIRLI